MPVISGDKIVELAQAQDPKKLYIKLVGDISEVWVPSSALFVATYIRPEKTEGGIIRPKENLKEDEYQGKVGLVLKIGEELEEDWLHKWVCFGYNDGFQFLFNKIHCRIISIDRIRMEIPDPTKVL